MAVEISCPSCNAPLRVREQYLGKNLKCPRCGAVVSVPPADGPLEQVRPVVRAAPPVPPETPAAGEAAERITAQEVRPAAAAMRRCPMCGETIAANVNRCRYCRAWLDEDDDDDEPERRPRRKGVSFRPCPRCGASGPERVTWTPWGSFYGPALFTHVRCRECGYGYNGRTGGSNLVPAVLMVAIPAILIVAIILGLLYMLGVLGARRF
jgi:predicted RNA-binding Zn-ribbon protein involved in translation (DUF1610 family)